MALGRVRGVVLVGVEGHVVEVEADLARGLPNFALVGLPDVSLHEARDRVRAAVVNSGQWWPDRRITVNLSPASLPKRGSGLDLAIAAALLTASGAVRPDMLSGTVLLGELGLDGGLRPVRGVLPAVAAAARAGVRRVVVPAANAAEARLVPQVAVCGLRSLRQLVAVANGDALPVEDALPADAPPPGESPDAGAAEPADLADGGSSGLLTKDLADVVGQALGRWALEVAAAGGHHLFLLGPPGAGKTMLAERLPGLLPDLAPGDALEVTAVHSVAGVLRPGVPLVRRPPLQAPHHTATVAAVVGGGSGVPRPGAASLAHRGVLFLDEAPEFAPRLLDALREPLESGSIVLARADGAAEYPARFGLVLAANPCPCGRSSGKGIDCSCPAVARRRYLSRLSGPLLDRIDLQLRVPALTVADVRGARTGAETSAAVAERVLLARERALARLRGTPWRTNAEVAGRQLRRRWPVADGAHELLDRHLATGALTMRGADRTLRIAWTIADLRGHARPSTDDMHEAFGLREMDLAR